MKNRQTPESNSRFSFLCVTHLVGFVDHSIFNGAELLIAFMTRMSSSISGEIPSNPSAQLQVVLDYLAATCEGNFDKIDGLLTEDFVHLIHPKSLGRSPDDKAAWIKFNVDVFPFFKDFKVWTRFLQK